MDAQILNGFLVRFCIKKPLIFFFSLEIRCFLVLVMTKTSFFFLFFLGLVFWVFFGSHVMF